jgi:excisionase family DNA binding protein
MLPPELTPREAATLCGVTVPTIHNWIASGKIAEVRRYGPRTFRIPAEQIEDLVASAVPLAVMRAAYNAIDSVFGVTIAREDIESIQFLRHGMERLTDKWSTVQKGAPLDLRDVMHCLASVAAASPLDYGELFNVIRALGEISCDKVLRSA